MPTRRKLFIVVASLLAAVVLVAGGSWLLARSSPVAARAAAVLTEATGRPASVGQVSVAYGPTLVVALDDVQLAAASGPPLLAVARIEVELPWGALRAGRPLRRLRLLQPAFRVELDAAGHSEWPAVVAQVSRWLGPGPAGFDIGELRIEEGRLAFRDGASGRSATFAAITLQAQGVRPAVPFDASLRFAGQSGGYTFHAGVEGRWTLDPDQNRHAFENLGLRGWLGGGRLPLAGVDARGRAARLGFDLAAGTAQLDGLDLEVAGVALTLQCRVSGLDAQPVATFALETREFNPRAAADALALPLPAMADATALGTARVAVRGSASGEAIELEPASFTLDASSGSGRLRWPLDRSAAPLLVAELDRIDLDRYLLPAAGGAGPPDPGAAVEAAVAALRALDLDARVTIGEARVAGAVFTRLRLVVEPDAR